MKETGKSSQKHNQLRIPAFAAFSLIVTWVIGVSYIRSDLLFHSNSAISNFVLFLGQIRTFPTRRLFVGLLELSAFFFIPIGLAQPIIRKLSDDSLDSLEEIIMSLGFGLGFLSLALLACGVLISFSPKFLRVFAGVIFTLSAANCWKTTWKPIRILHLPRSSIERAIISTSLAALVFLNLIAALGPEVFYDSLVYHLSLPQLYLTRGIIFPTPYNIYSGIPFNTEMLYGLGLALGGETLAKLLPWGLSLAILGLIFVWCRRFVAEEAGWIAALLFYSCPMIAMQAGFTLVELYWCFFFLLTIFSVMLWSDKGMLNKKWMILAGIFLGFSLGVKYNAIIVVPAVFGAAIMVGRKNNLTSRTILGNVSRMAAIAAVLVVPWLIKNWIFYHNPVYPFFNGSFPLAPAGIDWRGLVHDAKGRDLAAAFTSVNGFFDMFTAIWAREWSGFDSVGLAVLWGAPLLLFARGEKGHSILLFMLACGWLAWAMTSRMPRFLIFVMPVMSLALASAIESLRTRRLEYGVAVSIVLLGCIINCGEIFNRWMKLETWEAVVGGQTEADYLNASHPLYPTPYYAAVDFINKNLPLQAKVLFFEEARGYYCQREFIATTSFATNPFVRMIEEAGDSEALLRELRSENITHVLVNQAAILTRGRSNTVLTKRGEDIFASFRERHLKLLFERKFGLDPLDPMNVQWVQVYELV